MDKPYQMVSIWPVICHNSPNIHATDAFMSSMQYSAATDVGLKRSNNEDTVLSNPDVGLWVVADGMGGHAAGEVASAIAAETIEKHIKRGVNLQESIRLAHKAVIEAAQAGQGGAGMGSTVVALHSQGNTYEIAWVGDSRAYLWQPGSGSRNTVPNGNKHKNDELIQLTTDHSYVQMLFDTGAISADEMHQHPDKNIITQCLGSLDVDALSVDICRMQWYPNDWVLLCSDGLSDAVTDVQIQQVLQSHSRVDDATHALIELALDQGGKDNISVSLIACPNSGTNRLRNWWHRIRDRLAGS